MASLRHACPAVLVFLAIPAVLISATIHVPGDYAMIQEAIDAAANGDTVLVAAGTYIENINFLGKAIHLKSSDGPTATVIDGGHPSNPDIGSVVRFTEHEGLQTILEGFTLLNGTGVEIEFSSGHFGRFGGGILCLNSNPTIRDNIIKRNFADRSGGGIYSEGDSPIITGNLITQNSSYHGSGICCYYSDATIHENTITENGWLQGGNTYGGGIRCEGSDSDIAYNIITGNAAGYRGGGIYVKYKAPRIANNSINDNISGCEGGGISCFSVSSIVTENEIMNNTSHFGGAIYSHTSSFSVNRNLISGNTGTLGVGGVYGGGDLIENTIVNNSTGGTVGGASWGAGMIARNIIADNSANGEDAGGLRCGNATVSANIITGNYAVNKGGGVDCNKGSVLTNNVIFGNKAGNKGGGIACDFEEATLVNNVITQNWASQNGGGYWSGSHADVVMINSVLWDNDSPDGKEISLAGFSSLLIRSSDIKGGQAHVEVIKNGTLTWGDGNIDADPLFVDPANSDFHLTFQSPCRGSGNNSAPSLPVCDFEGDPRIYQGTVDIGADEFHPHLYATGTPTPGAMVEGKIIGLPGSAPVALLIGSGTLPSPIPTAWGDFYLQYPLEFVELWPIPSTGVLILPVTVPHIPSAPYDIPMQALIGLNHDSLSNLFVLKVR